MNLSYEAVDGAGRTIRNLIEADTVKAAMERLRQKGLMVTQIAAASGAELQRSARAAQATQAAKLPLKQLVLFTRQMAMLLASGSAVVPALQAIARQMKKPQYTQVIRHLIKDLEGGSGLTEALIRQPQTFQATYCAIIAAGESSATLPAMFTRLAKMVAKQRAIRNKVISSATYPGLLIFLSIGIINLMLFFILPRFNGMFESMGVPLPASTRALLALAAICEGYWPVIVVTVLSVIGTLVYLAKTRQGRRWCANAQTKIPVVGKVRNGLIQGQVFRTLGMLIEARVGVLESVDLIRGLTTNEQYQKLFERIEQAVTSGGSFSDALEHSKLVDPAICQAVRTGEDSGNLGGALTYAADVLDEDNEELVSMATKLVEPLILIGMGLLVGVMAVSLFLPLFEMTSLVQ